MIDNEKIIEIIEKYIREQNLGCIDINANLLIEWLRNYKEIKDVEGFNKFRNIYDKKIGKPKCESKWNRLSKKDKDCIFSTLPLYLSTIKDKQFQKHPLTYLNGRSWEDEIITVKQKEFTYDDFKSYMRLGRYAEAKEILGTDKFFEFKKQWLNSMDFNT